MKIKVKFFFKTTLGLSILHSFDVSFTSRGYLRLTRQIRSAATGADPCRTLEKIICHFFQFLLHFELWGR